MHKYENVNCGKLIKIIWRKPLFDGLSFSIAEGQRAGIIGVNGTGKSTLLKIIAGAEIPDTGDMTHSRGYTISYLSQQPEFDEQLTVLEQVFHGDTPLIRLLRDYEKALLHIEKIQAMKRYRNNYLQCNNVWMRWVLGKQMRTQNRY